MRHRSAVTHRLPEDTYRDPSATFHVVARGWRYNAQGDAFVGQRGQVAWEVIAR
jgi:hypothetical protein